MRKVEISESTVARNGLRERDDADGSPLISMRCLPDDAKVRNSIANALAAEDFRPPAICTRGGGGGFKTRPVI